MPADPAPLLAEALRLALLLSVVPAAAALLAGGLASLLGTRLGTVDPIVSAVPRAAGALLALLAAGPWIAEEVVRFAQTTLAAAFGL